MTRTTSTTPFAGKVGSGPRKHPGASAAGNLRTGIICGLVAAVIWGAFVAASRQGIGAGLHAADLAFIRYTTAGLLLAPWLWRRSPRTLAGVGVPRGAVLAGLAGPLFVLAGASGYLFAPLAHGAVIQLGMLTLMSICLAALVLGERPGKARIAGLLVLITGLAVIAGPAILDGGSQAWLGDLLFATAGSMWAAFSILVRRWRVEAVAATAIVSVLSALAYAPLYLVFVGIGRIAAAPPMLIAEQVLVQGALSGVVALFAFSRAVQLLGAGRAALFPALAPAVAILIGIPLVGEIPTGGQWLGLAIVSAGLLIAMRDTKTAGPVPDAGR